MPNKDASFYAKFHDAELIGVRNNRKDSTLSLEFLFEDGGVQTVVLNDVMGLRVNGMISQNIVSRLLVSNVYKFTDEEVHRWIEWANSEPDGGLFINQEAVRRYTQEIQSGRTVLFVLEPSWGAECAAVCGSVSLFPVGLVA